MIPILEKRIYNYAYLLYNISVIVKKESTYLESIRKLIQDQNGTLLTSDLEKYRIPRVYLAILESKGEIQRISRGVYTASTLMGDEMYNLQARYKVAVFSHETALYLLGLTDRSPLFYTVTVSSGYNATSLKSNGVKVFYVKRDFRDLGLITMKSSHGNTINAYNLERTICDVVRCRHQLDIQFISQALKKYVVHPGRNLNLLHEYARQFTIQKMVREYIEVLL